MLLYDTCYTIIGLVYSALLPEVSESDAERNGLQISSSLFGLLGTLLGFLIPDFFRPKGGEGDPTLLPLRLATIVVAIVGGLLIISTTLKVKERPEFTKVDKPLPIIASLKYTFTSKSFVILVAENFMVILTSSLVTGSIFYLADYVMRMSTIILLACIFIPIFIAVPLTTVIRRKLGVLRTQQLLLVFAGFGLAGPQTLTNVLFAQVADEDELRTGVRREGSFFGVNALITKPAQSIALALPAWILESTQFITRQQNNGAIFLDQPASALTGIKIFIGLIPGIALLLGALILQYFPLKGMHLEQMQEDVLALHAEKSARLQEMEDRS